MVNRLAPAPAVDDREVDERRRRRRAPGPFVPIGSAVTWTYLVTNTGNVPLSAVNVTDDRA